MYYVYLDGGNENNSKKNSDNFSPIYFLVAVDLLWHEAHTQGICILLVLGEAVVNFTAGFQ